MWKDAQNPWSYTVVLKPCLDDLLKNIQLINSLKSL